MAAAITLNSSLRLALSHLADFKVEPEAVHDPLVEEGLVLGLESLQGPETEAPPVLREYRRSPIELVVHNIAALYDQVARTVDNEVQKQAHARLRLRSRAAARIGEFLCDHGDFGGDKRLLERR